MQEIESDGAMIDICTSCRGTFLDAGEADHFIDDPQKLADALTFPLLDPQTGHPCPRCGAVTSEGGLFDAEFRVELCAGCGGMWLVSRQLSRLRKLVADATAPNRQVTKKAKKGAKTAAATKAPAKAGATQHRCPSCLAEATRWDRWTCTCGTVWDAFTTRGVCPNCQKHWDNTRCPRCGNSNPHAEWYV